MFYEILSNTHKGKKISEEHKQKIREKIGGKNNYQWVERTEEMIEDLKKLTVSEWRKKHNQSRNMFYRLREEYNIIKDDRQRNITNEMIYDANFLDKYKFCKKHKCRYEIYDRIKNGEIKI